MSDENVGPPDSAATERRAVLDVFGLKLEVSNPRLAELLTMDAREGLGTDVRTLGAETVRELRAETQQAVPDVVVAAPPTVKDENEAIHRREFRSEATAVGTELGFDATPDGVWHSPTGMSVLTRTVDRPVSLAAATHFVDEIGARRAQISGPDSTVLFIVDSQQSADVFKVAIRQRNLYHVMRVISIDNLRDIRVMASTGEIDHAKGLILLTPAANIDVGEIMSVIRARVSPAEGEPQGL